MRPRRPSGSGGFRGVPIAVGQALRARRRARLLATALAQVNSTPDDGDGGEWLGRGVRLVRRVTTGLRFDQMKAVILDDEPADSGRLLENPEFLRFVAHWGFRIRACRPYRAKTERMVERPIRYVRGNFIYGREFIGGADLGD